MPPTKGDGAAAQKVGREVGRVTRQSTLFVLLLDDSPARQSPCQLSSRVIPGGQLYYESVCVVRFPRSCTVPAFKTHEAEDEAFRVTALCALRTPRLSSVTAVRPPLAPVVCMIKSVALKLRNTNAAAANPGAQLGLIYWRSTLCNHGSRTPLDSTVSLIKQCKHRHYTCQTPAVRCKQRRRSTGRPVNLLGASPSLRDANSSTPFNNPGQSPSE